MIYREVELPEALNGAAFCAWRFVIEPTDPPHVQHSIPPDGTTNLVLVRDAGARLHPGSSDRAWRARRYRSCRAGATPGFGCAPKPRRP